MTRYTLTPKLEQLIAASSLSKEIKESVLSKTDISHVDLINFYKAFKPTDSLLELLKLTSLQIPNKNEKLSDKPKSREFVKSMEKLRLQEKENEYQRLVNPAPQYSTLYENSAAPDITPAMASKELKNQITTIVNILISVASVAYAIWYWTESSWKLPDSYRILLCLFFALLVLVAEVVVYLGYLNKIEEARKTERSKKEVKKVIRTVELGPKNKIE
ncbi:vacuolar H+-ATPase assembly protein [Scheffersomyces stipitis CBS 6054]|uniref:Vacuolar H+-ATPase assembly protein n=1 Tax=Scheffersomyces stipitis (strain ATCC 58785 / CBS 6054 / NBRC 10063 / NRRL Y-11545) TaxID=322104 RepID=A3GHZ8_PICST|nr:vacuolar H+-ATPase assembly protein [Scheffersomyces stipitis CBS 6054]EAZ63142.2 vacuolar H+-ATPase assembly protein [Scheffersomyces stipitis CBS 6054]KAG2735026.1 hypothetical protein G9P44_001240 [Scheffersomyces stipitis]